MSRWHLVAWAQAASAIFLSGAYRCGVAYWRIMDGRTRNLVQDWQRLFPQMERVSDAMSRSSSARVAASLHSGHAAVAILVWCLSGRLAYALAFLAYQAPVWLAEARQSCGSEASIALELLNVWRRATVSTYVDAAAGAFNNPHRVKADIFLMESLEAEYVWWQNLSGHSVPTHAVIDYFLHIWSLREVPPRLERCLRRLAWHKHSWWRFSAELRRAWMLDQSMLTEARPISRDTISRRVLTK